MNDKIYVPNFDNNTCVSIDYINSGYLRAYQVKPYANSTIAYTDYFVNSHYLDRTGYQTFGNYNTAISCISTDRLTNQVEYRNDFNEILLTFVLLALIVVFIPTKIVFRFFRRCR